MPLSIPAFVMTICFGTRFLEAIVTDDVAEALGGGRKVMLGNVWASASAWATLRPRWGTFRLVLKARPKITNCATTNKATNEDEDNSDV